MASKTMILGLSLAALFAVAAANPAAAQQAATGTATGTADVATNATSGARSRNMSVGQICGDCIVEKFTSECPGRLEGPNFDKQGNLWMLGNTAGDIYKVTPDGHCTTVAHTPAPSGLRFHKDGRLFGTDRRAGLFWIDTGTLEVHYITNEYNRTNFHGLDDLVFDSTGGIYMTDAYGSSALNPIGQLFYASPTNQISKLVATNMAFPNGVVLSPDEKTLYVDDWGTNRILAMPVLRPGQVDTDSAYVFAYLQGGHGPDSMTADAHGNIYAAHYGAGEVVVFNPLGFSYGAIRLPEGAGQASTNVAIYNGYLYVTEMDQHTVWRVKVIQPPMTSFADR